MGDKQSRTVAASGGDASDASKETEVAPGDAAAGEWQAGPLDPGSSSSSSTAVPEDAVPSESEILARLVANLGQCPGRSLALAKIRECLPPALRRLAEDTDSICRWLQGFPGLFEVSGPPGAEQITLTVGKLPRPGGGAEAPPPAAGTSQSSATPGDDEAAGADAGEALAAVPGRASSPSDSPVPAPGGDAGEEEGLSPSAVQLRGLPFRATIGDIKAFLGEHAYHLAATAEPAVRLLLNRDGRPSGFARVQFTSPRAAQACREKLHRQPMGDRYVEVLACSDRAGKARHRRAAEAAPEGAPAGDGASEYLERERVLQECQEHMRMPGRNQLLLSMLGIALSPPARAYLRRASLGLKHFLARFPNEFRVEGPKGCERVIWCGVGAGGPPPGGEPTGAAAASTPLVDFAGGGWPGPPLLREPSTPKLAPSSNKAQLSHSGHCVRTPSDWGTPGPMPPQQTALPEANAASSMDFSTFAGGGNWPTYNWAPPWAMAGQPWVQWPPEALRGDPAAGRPATSSGRRGARGEVSASRSHAHLHPQSHPFASRAASGTGSTASDGAAGPGASADADGSSSAVPALRLRGLPFNVTVQDVLAFFAQHEVADRIADGPQAAQLLPKANGRPSGQAVVQMRSRYDAEIAQKALYHQFIGGRYIEVFVYGDENDPQGQDASAHLGGPAGEGKGPGDAAVEWHAGAAAPWPLPPWAAVAQPVPGGVTAGGQDVEAREGDAWGQIFNWLWHGHEQMPEAAAGASAPAAPGAGAAAPPLGLQAHEAPPRATLQV